MLQRCLDFVFPPFCAACDRIGSYLCPRHLNDLCWNYHPPLEGWIWSAVEYRDSAQAIVKQVKYSFYYRYSLLIAQLIILRFSDFASRHQIDLIVPVPLHRRRRHWRGFNQAELVAKQLGKYWNLPVEAGALTKLRHTKSQASQNREQRQAIEHQFRAAAPLSGKKVLLIDDVVTTGSTLLSCRAALEEAGATNVLGLTFAHET